MCSQMDDKYLTHHFYCRSQVISRWFGQLICIQYLSTKQLAFTQYILLCFLNQINVGLNNRHCCPKDLP